jgi:post-segregation antitoxin (ccd killing protein)
MLLLVSACGLLVEEGRQVVAEVGGEPIRLDHVLRRIRELPFQERAKTNDPNEAVRMQARLGVLEELVVEQLLQQEARARGVEVSDEEVYAALEEEERKESASAPQTEGDGNIHEHGHAHDHSGAEVKEMREKLMMTKLLKQQFSEEVLRSYYQQNLQEFRTAPRFSYEILVVDVAHSKAVDAVYQKAKAGASVIESFRSLERKPPTVFLGRTPPAPLDKLAPEMREQVKALQLGEVSKPFHLNPGDSHQYAVARLIGRIEVAPFENVRGQIFKGLYEGFLEELKKKHNVVYYKEKLDYQLGR